MLLAKNKKPTTESLFWRPSLMLKLEGLMVFRGTSAKLRVTVMVEWKRERKNLSGFQQLFMFLQFVSLQ